MATDLHAVKPAPAAKRHEVFVEAQLARARARIRYLDLGAAVLGWLIVTLVYGLVLALFDHWLGLSALARQIAFALYAAGGLVYVGLLVFRPLCRQVNPYYAARQLERTIPEAKNSIVNWLDLHQQAIAPAFRSAIGQQAAKDLADVNLEQAISARRTSWLGAGAGALFICTLILFVLGPGQLRTRIELERPEGGDITIPVGRAVGFSVWVEGRVPATSSPDALRLLYRYNLSDPYQARLLERGESSRQWFTNLLAREVHNGFWYKVAGGNAETAEYRVQVRSTPLLTGFDVTYHYRPYLKWPDRITHDQNLQDLRGTEVNLLARTNRILKEGTLDIEGQKPIPAEMVSGDPQAMRFRLRLENDGNYRIWFKSVEEERNTDPMAYAIRVLQDHPPQVELAKPGEDSELPANGVLHLAGSASDDFGIASLNLRMKVENGAALPAKPYRKGEALRRSDGSYPQMLAYRDFVELNKLQREDGNALEPLPVGAQLEYWLEATDNCDYPAPNIGESKHFKVTIRAADADQKKQEQERQEARQEQQKHEQQQDQDLQKQKSEARDTPQEQNPRPADADQQNKQGGQQNEEQLNKQKEEIEKAIKENEQQQQGGEKGESKGGQSQESKSETASKSPADKSQDKGKEGEAKPQPGQDKGRGKSEANIEKGQQQGEGQTAPHSNANRQNPGGQQGSEQGNKERSEPAPRQDNGASQTGKNAQPRPKPNGNGQPPDQAAPQSTSGEKNPKPNGGEGTPGENTHTKKEQNPGGSQERRSSQSEGKSGAEPKTAQPEAGQGTTGEKPEPRIEKAEKKEPGQEKSKQQAGQAKGEPKQGSGSEKAKENPQQPAGNPQGGEKQENGNSGQRPEKGQQQDAAEPRGDQKGGSPGESKADKQASPQQEKAGEGRGDSTKPKAAGTENPKSDARANAAKAQEQPTGADKANGDNRGMAKPDKKENSQNPAARGAQATDQAEDKDKVGSGSQRDGQPQQSKPERTGGTQTGEKSPDDMSALSEVLQSGNEKARANARKRLEELRDKAHDPSVRRSAADALKRADQENSGTGEQKPDGSRGPAGKERSEPANAGESGARAAGQEKGKDGQKPATQKSNEGETGPSGPAKSEPKNADRMKGQGDSESATGERNNQAASPKKPGGSGASGRTGGNDPAAPKSNPEGFADDPPQQGQDSTEPTTPANAAYQKRAGELQLEEIKKKINKDVLKQLNMTQEEFDKFAKAYEEMLQRKPRSPSEKETLAAPQKGNRSLPNDKIRLVDPREQAKDGKLQRLGPAVAPAEFREAYKEFSRRISELEQPKEKK